MLVSLVMLRLLIYYLYQVEFPWNKIHNIWHTASTYLCTYSSSRENKQKILFQEGLAKSSNWQLQHCPYHLWTECAGHPWPTTDALHHALNPGLITRCRRKCSWSARAPSPCSWRLVQEHLLLKFTGPLCWVQQLSIFWGLWTMWWRRGKSKALGS